MNTDVGRTPKQTATTLEGGTKRSTLWPRQINRWVPFCGAGGTPAPQYPQANRCNKSYCATGAAVVAVAGGVTVILAAFSTMFRINWKHMPGSLPSPTS